MDNALYEKPLISLPFDRMDAAMVKKKYFLEKEDSGEKSYALDDVYREAVEKYKDDPERLEQIERNAKRFRKEISQRQRRLEMLVQALERHGLELRGDSWLTRSFIYRNETDLRNAVYTMHKMKVLNEHCNIRHRWQKYLEEREATRQPPDEQPPSREERAQIEKERFLFYDCVYADFVKEHPEHKFKYIPYRPQQDTGLAGVAGEGGTEEAPGREEAQAPTGD
ncbi:unnamed protein product [Vitrella brassicaformis CCMP3155]|uniref:Uncharacterized protein n=1 Tax=Vitrella brassicaformis (strain CCMP3155) TaxID=1169540 RepID=A0A0G4FDV8_VITBC|nr:unnamed protein product [Vitrella brassicaformis CCMP3155]|eukprot:CEM11382.1 unnamed protein product [Vitrella brassicaformis CCMP3155]